MVHVTLVLVNTQKLITVVLQMDRRTPLCSLKKLLPANLNYSQVVHAATHVGESFGALGHGNFNTFRSIGRPVADTDTNRHGAITFAW